MIVERTGTDDRPRPGSSAMRTPALAAVEAPAPASAPPTREPAVTRAVARRLRAERGANNAASTLSNATTTNTLSAPIPRYARFTAIPGCSSASRATPTGDNAESSTAVTAAMTVAPAPISTPRETRVFGAGPW